MNVPEPFDEQVLRRVPWEILAVSAVLAVVVGLIFGPLTGLLFFAGGGLSALGFAWLKRSLSRLLLQGKTGALRSGIALYVLRLALICGVFFLIILLFPGRVLAFVAGFSVLVPVALAESVRALLLMKTWKN
ncbi:MAG: ATP synthase subunit I [Candidatus Aminicenantes bacterium]